MRHSAQFLLVVALAVSPLPQAGEPGPAGVGDDTGQRAIDTPAEASASTTAASVEPAGNPLPDVDLAILLDPDADPDARQAQLQLIELHAAQGKGWSNYVLGSLYRMGEQHPAKLVKRDATRAEAHLRTAGLTGETWAMSGLAELMLVENEPRKALLWAHLFAHYRRLDHPPGESSAQGRQAYAASLLLRSATALERAAGDYGSIQGDLDEFVARHDADIRAGMVARRGSVADKIEARPENRLVQASSRLRRSEIGTGEPGQAIYRISVGRDGRVERVLIVDSVPDRRFGWRMRNIARRARFNPSPDADPLRWAIMPMMFDDHSVSLRPRATTTRTDTPRP